MDDHRTDTAISDDELTALALGADPHPVIDPRIAPWRPTSAEGAGPLPEWYMPRAVASTRRPSVRLAVGVIIASFVVINALGLCVTYGFVTVA
jgi:hypothetical protein